MNTNQSTARKASLPAIDDTNFSSNNTYNDEQARRYFAKHTSSFARRLSNWLEYRMAARALALAGHPKSVLDLPCGAGRFWSLLASMPDRYLIGSDHSEDMIKTALRFQPPQVTARFNTLQTSAFDIHLPDASVDCIFCMRLFHHINRQEAREKILRQFHRVSRNTVCLSLWIDGNLQAFKRSHSHHDHREYTRFLFKRSRIEREFVDCGFDILGSVGLLPGFSMLYTYILGRRQ